MAPNDDPGAFGRDQVLAALGAITEPGTGRGLTELGMVSDVTVTGGDVALTIERMQPLYPHEEAVEAAVREALAATPGAGSVRVTWDTRIRSSGAGRSDAQPISGIRNTIAVASGKGGVGKSTVAVNLAVTLARAGARVGLLDADVYGPSIPLMMGVHDKPLMNNNRIVPLEAHGVRVMSIGFLLDPQRALIWRGPLVTQLINQFLNDVEWGQLDYLIIDLPPGTGDVQLTLVQKIPISGAVIVTTPQDVALADAVKGLKMFQEVKTPVLGIIENMSGFICPNCHEVHRIFGEGGGRRTAEQYDVPYLGEVPIEQTVREGGDEGVPVAIAHPESQTAAAFTTVAGRVAGAIAAEAVRKPRKPVIMLKSTPAR
jgi:ATP-binding protein involved in chromosome partitioning